MKKITLILMLLCSLLLQGQNLDGIVVSDYRSMNTALCSGTVEGYLDHKEALTTAYLETPDALRGYKLVFEGLYSNRLRRGDYIRIDLSKCVLSGNVVEISDPSCIRIGRRNVPIPQKVRTFASLSEEDVYTLVTFTDVERATPSLVSDALGATLPVALYETEMEYSLSGTLRAVPVVENGVLVLRPILQEDIAFAESASFRDVDYTLTIELIRSKVERKGASVKILSNNRRWFRFNDDDLAVGYNGIVLKSKEVLASFDVCFASLSQSAPALWNVWVSEEGLTWRSLEIQLKGQAGEQKRILLPDGTKAVKLQPCSTQTLTGDINNEKPCDCHVAFDILKITKR